MLTWSMSTFLFASVISTIALSIGSGGPPKQLSGSWPVRCTVPPMISGGGGRDPSGGLLWQTTQVMPGSIWLELELPMVHVVMLEHIGGMSKGLTPPSPSQVPFGIPFDTHPDITAVSPAVAGGLGIGGIGFS